MLSQLIITALPLLAVPISALTVLSDVLYNGTVIAETQAGALGPDAPKLTPITANDTSYDWWYFDAVSQKSNASLSVVFYDAGPDGFVNTYLTGPYTVSLVGAFANGTLFDISIDSSGGVVLDYESPDGSITGWWLGPDNAGFLGTSLTDYKIIIDAPEVGVAGFISLQSVAPPHFSCGPDAIGSTEAVIPHIWWSNAVPDAIAVVDLIIDGSPLVFADGVGYHDKNWGDAPFLEAVSSWYWGHARIGPYSIVWFDGIGSDGVEHASGFVSQDSEILTANCTAGAVVVRPWGDNDTYPPLITTGMMEGLEATFTLDNGSVFVANITTGLPLIDVGAYIRTIGTVEGGIVGGTTYTDGRAMFEEFKLGV